MSKQKNTYEHDITPANQSHQCRKCGLAVADDGVTCTECKQSFHVQCLSLQISPQLRNSWVCDECRERIRLNDEKSKSSTTSKSCSSRSSTSRRNALRRIEEEKRMQEELLNTKLREMAKIQQEYLDKKYALESDSQSDGDGAKIPDHEDTPKEERIVAWLQKVPITANAQNNEHQAGGFTSAAQAGGFTSAAQAGGFTSAAKAGGITSTAKPKPQTHQMRPGAENVKNHYPNVMNATNFSYVKESCLTQEQIAARHCGLKILPTFSGDSDEWPAFIVAYYTSTSYCGFDDYENRLRLANSLKGEAKEAVKALLILPTTVPQAISVLEMMYGSPDTIINSLLEKLQALPSIKADNLRGYIKLSTSVDNFVATVEALQMHSHLNNPCLLKSLVGKLPAEPKMNWGIYCGHVFEVNMKTFGDWIRQRAYAAIKVSPSIPATESDHKGQRGKHFVNVHEQTQSTSKCNPCLKCNGSCARIRDCDEFKKANVEDRIAIVKDNKLCWTCLGDHKKKCFSKKLCGIGNCTSKHNRLLHKEESTSEPELSLHHVNHSKTTAIKTWFRIIAVKLYNGSCLVDCFAMLDEGSSVTLINSSLARELNLEGPEQPLCLKWTGGTTRMEEGSMLVNLKISGGKNKEKYHLSNVHTVLDLDLPTQTISREDIEKHTHLKGLESCTYSNAKPMLLIGLNNATLGVMRDVREGRMNEPIASNTKLGWVIHGSTNSPNKDIQDFSYHVCDCQQLHEAVKSYFSLESLGVVRSDKRLLSVDDANALQIMKDTTKRDGDRFVTGLIWKHENVVLPDSYSMTYRRLQCLESKMRKDPHLAEIISNQIAAYESKGYIRKLTSAEIHQTHPRTWYLPIFTVTNPNKPSKVRIVWDAAARVGGISLNSVLLSGPDQVASMLGVLMRFRQNKIGVTADIEEMFHQVRVKKEDQQSQRFLWREDSSCDPDVYIMQVLTFGSTSSPASAQFVKNTNAEQHKDQYPAASKAITDCHYVDDYLDSVSSVEGAINLSEEVRYIHKRGGFNIRNWLSNSPVVEQALNSSSTVNSKSMNISYEPDKILGLWWNKLDDTFQFQLKVNDTNRALIEGQKVPTKRELLSITMKIFDPLGLISNFLVFLKILLQDVWKSSINWDECIKPAQFQKWKQWKENLSLLENIRIPRWHFGNQTSDSKVDLHVFVDASIHAYAAVAYFRYASEDGFKCSLVASKTKVSPIKLTSIPRLELQSAVLGVRLASSIKQQHTMIINKCVFWSDSKTVLLWLNTSHQTLKQFVAFRVGEILEASDASDWRYVPTKNNIADKATKWPHDRFKNSFNEWTNGPEFLQQDEFVWLKSENIQDTPDSEAERIHFHHEAVCKKVVDSSKFSSWTRMVRCVAFVLRFVENLKPTSDRKCGRLLMSDELEKAEMYLLKQSQQEEFCDDIKTLEAGGFINKKSCLYKESAYLDEVGLLRVNGRIDAACDVSEDTKRPIILSKKNYICFLLVRSFHLKFHHLYDETALNEIKQKFRIGQLRVLLKGVKAKCQLCKNKRSVPKPPLMSSLPKARLSSFTRPFTFIGLDFFGPLNVTVGRSCQKRWVLIVTCLTIRAVHLEVSHSLSTDSFILSLKNFMARRGSPREIYSDNGTNFRGAAEEIRAFMTDKSKMELVAEKFITSETSWKFIPPASPHMGGSWERMVRSIKNTLRAITPPRNPTDPLLQSMLLECEMVVNSRPLTFVALDTDSSDALTPNHFLLGSSSGSKPIGTFSDGGALLRKHWMKSEQYANQFWKRWTKEYLPSLTRRSKWFERTEPLKAGDIVIVVDENNPRNCWPKGRIISTTAGKDNQVRSAVVQTEKGIYTRPAVKLAALDVYEDANVPEEVGTLPGGSVTISDQPITQTLN